MITQKSCQLLVLFMAAGLSSAAAQEPVENRLRALEAEVGSLKHQLDDVRRKSSLLSMSEEVKQTREYVCARGHIHDEVPVGGKCPIDGTPVKERVTYRKVKLARQESIAEKIAATLEEDAKKRVLVGASATGVLQQVGRSGVAGSTQRLFSEGSVDLYFVSRPAAFSTLFINLEGVGGQGPDKMLGSLSGLNDDAGRHSDPADKVMVREAWIRSDFWKRQAWAVAGKVDLSNYFDANRVANDETTQFLTSVFVNNPLLENPANGPGAALFLDPGRAFYAGVGVQSGTSAADVRYKDVYTIAEAGARLHWLYNREGTYRLWVRRHGQAGNFGRAAGLSIDQRLLPRWLGFARFGLTDRGQADRATAWSAGLAFVAPWERVNDQLGVGFSRLERRAVGRENAVETFYRLFLTDHLAVTPNVQALFGTARAGNQALADPTWVFGVRMQTTF